MMMTILAVYLLGPHGNLRWDTRGELIIRRLNQQQLRAASTFFNSNNKHDTWIHPATKKKTIGPPPNQEKLSEICSQCENEK